MLATTEAPPRIVFSTHMDTVPPFIESSEDEEFIYGRGSCDAKGIIAAQILAAHVCALKVMNNLGLLFTVDEELGSTRCPVRRTNIALARECRYLSTANRRTIV